MTDLTLTDAEIGLLILMLIEDIAKNGGGMIFENVSTNETANSTELLSKLISTRDKFNTRRIQ